jgi:site-specific DNA-adenine methylase
MTQLDLLPQSAPRLRPFFSYYGSKWRSAPHYPAPIHGNIIEPFAGSAGYSMLYPAKRVTLCDLSPVICGVWDYIINAPESEIRALPLPKGGESIRDLHIPEEAAWLIGFWAQEGSTHPGRQASTWGSRPGRGWRAAARERIASQQQYVRHWRVVNSSYAELPDDESTWFIDPPYNNAAGAKYYSSAWASPIDFDELAAFCKSRAGQVIVCENDGATWLPFEHLGNFRASTKRDGRTHSSEAIWTNAKR